MKNKSSTTLAGGTIEKNNIQIISQTMTSIELAELSGKEHKNVKRNIELIFNNVGIDTLKFEHIYTDSMN